jgi:hypothetical protein
MYNHQLVVQSYRIRIKFYNDELAVNPNQPKLVELKDKAEKMLQKLLNPFGV